MQTFLSLNSYRFLRFSPNAVSNIRCMYRSLAIPTDQQEFLTRRHQNSGKLLPQSAGKYQREISTVLDRNCNGTIGVKWAGLPAVAAVSPLADEGNHHNVITDVYHYISESLPVTTLQQVLVDIHDGSGLPWWASIVLSTVLFRSVVTFPLIIYQYQTIARLENVKCEMSKIVDQLMRDATIAMQTFQLTKHQTRLLYNSSLRTHWNQLIVRDNCHPAKTFIVLWAQVPLWIGLSMAIRNLVYMMPNPTAVEAQNVFAELTVGGFGWIENLTLADSSFILPVTLGIINLAIIELQLMLRQGESTRLQNIISNVFRVFSVAMVSVAGAVPSALVLYWVTSSSYSILQNLLLVSPRIRRILRIPQTKHELITPYSHLWQRLKQRLHLESK